ncbi:zinc finger protein ZXDC-like, partial [Elysia marginata]
MTSMIAGTLCINNGVPRFVIFGDDCMMKKGSVSVAKDGGAHGFVFEQQPQFSVNISGSKSKIFKINVSEAPAKSQDSHSKPDHDNSLSRKDGVMLDSTPAGRANDLIQTEEIEASRSQTLDWVKPEIHLDLNCVDAFEMEVAKDSNLPSSYSIGIDGNTELTDQIADFVFSSTLPENSNTKPEYASYLETLDNGDHITHINSFSEPSVSWGSNLHLSQPSENMLVPQILVQPGDVLTHCHADTSGVAPSTHKIEGHNNGDVGTRNIFLSNEHSSSLLDSSKPVSTLNVVQGPTSNFVEDAFNLNSYQVEISTAIPSITSQQHISTVSLLDKPAVHSGSLAVSDVTNDLNLSQLPNFLGLDACTPAHSLEKGMPTALSTDSTLNLLDTMGETTALQHMEQTNEILGPDTTENIELDISNKQNLNVTTISISNDDQYATKILVNTHEGQQQMYVINATDLNQLQNGSSCNQNISHLFVINNDQKHPAENADNNQFVLTPEPVVSQASTNLNSTQVKTGTMPELTNDMSGFVLLPVVDNTTEAVPNAPPVPADNSGSEEKRALKKIFLCPEPGCNKTFKKASKLKVHQMMHTGERPFKCDKPGCGHRFTTIYNLNTHRKLHERACTEVCPQEGCGQSFPTKRQLDMHLRNVHSIEEHTFKCPEPGCDKVFFSSASMGSHMKVHRQNLEDLRCKHPGCGKQFTKLCRLRQHQQLHSGQKPYACTYPGCNWAFPTSSKLKRHMTKHTGYRKWTCSICHKQFQRSEHLKGHLITHSGDRPFVCPVSGCGNSFAAKSSLYVHLKKHDESGKTIVYHCPMENCNNFYANKASLRQHILVKHCALPSKDGTNGTQIMSSWLSLLGNGEDSLREEGSNQPPAVANQDALLATDFLTG